MLVGCWRADPVASLLLIPFFIKERRKNSAAGERGHAHEHRDNHDNKGKPEQRYGYLHRSVCCCLNCLYGLRACQAACCRA